MTTKKELTKLLDTKIALAEQQMAEVAEVVKNIQGTIDGNSDKLMELNKDIQAEQKELSESFVPKDIIKHSTKLKELQDKAEELALVNEVLKANTQQAIRPKLDALIETEHSMREAVIELNEVAVQFACLDSINQDLREFNQYNYELDELHSTINNYLAEYDLFTGWNKAKYYMLNGKDGRRNVSPVPCHLAHLNTFFKDYLAPVTPKA